MKICSRCSQEKSLAEFQRAKYGLLGHRAECKRCASIATSQRRNHTELSSLGRHPHKPPPSWCLNREDLAWAAGFYEGEGTIIAPVRRRNPNYVALALQVGQTNREPLERFRAVVAGLGKIYGAKLRPGRRPIYLYQAWTLEAVQAIIALLWPWLSQSRKRQADAALRAFRHSLTGTHGAHWRSPPGRSRP